MNNSPEDLSRLFWKSNLTIRYGVAENLYGHAAIDAYRKTRAASGGALKRILTRTVITTFGRDFGVADTEFLRTKGGRTGRQSQTWVRFSEGWRIVSAHVSFTQESD